MIKILSPAFIYKGNLKEGILATISDYCVCILFSYPYIMIFGDDKGECIKVVHSIMTLTIVIDTTDPEQYTNLDITKAW